MYEIKKQIIRYRIENNLTQKELADKIGTKQSAISRLENDDYNPSVLDVSAPPSTGKMFARYLLPP